MTQEEKSILLQDLCARLPYGVKFHYTKHPQSNVDQDYDGTAIGYYCNLIVSANDKDFCADRCKPYLRPMSSMTKEEQKKFDLFFSYGEHEWDSYTIADEVPLVIDWLNKRMFDYRYLISQGLALEAPEGMYNV